MLEFLVFSECGGWFDLSWAVRAAEADCPRSYLAPAISASASLEGFVGTLGVILVAIKSKQDLFSFLFLLGVSIEPLDQLTGGPGCETAHTGTQQLPCPGTQELRPQSSFSHQKQN